jgi:DNA invertase Pin-like site-specific DNA recombinase
MALRAAGYCRVSTEGQARDAAMRGMALKSAPIWQSLADITEFKPSGTWRRPDAT